MSLLDAPLSHLGGWGARYQKILTKRDIHTVRNLLWYFPYRIDDFSTTLPIADIKPGMQATVCGTIQMIANRRSPRTRKVVTEALLGDASGSIKVVWFNQSFLIKNLKAGDMVCFAGKVSDHFYDLQFVSPSYEKYHDQSEQLHTGRCVSVYSLPESVSLKIFRTLVRKGLNECIASLSEWMPQTLIEQEHLMPLPEALRSIHFPDDVSLWDRARTRLKYEELLLLQLSGQQARSDLKTIPAQPIIFDESLTQDYIQSLPYTLTTSQEKSLKEVAGDLGKSVPMNRLLEGDVGSGKTVVASVAMLQTAACGMQSGFMAPTELLARQHFQTLCVLLARYSYRICLLTSSKVMTWSKDEGLHDHESKKNRGQCIESIRKGDVQIVIGTHALLEERVEFRNITLIVIDEQHRFGVRQRKLLREKNASGFMPHLLSMTATPIPRSLALVFYGDLDISIMDELPRGRKKIITKIVPSKYREWTYDFVRKLIAKGQQALIICPLIDPSDILGARSVTQEYTRLREKVFPDICIGMLHGKLKSKEKEKIMSDFSEKRVSLLVATSVVEVGMDIPDATIMMIEGAERFGLAQLHQFRGRIGRSHHQAYCFLLPSGDDQKERVRLKALVSCSSGFDLAEKDLELRGSGEVFGQRQSGLPDFKLASLSDRDIIQKTRDYAKEIIQNIDMYPAVQERLKEYQQGELRD